ncbi:MAG: homoserine kinase [Cyanobacteria bacterium P01_F01_bin.42]
MTSSISVTVPATTANIGPGFDCLGAALGLYNHFEFEQLAAGASAVTITAEGLEADRLSIGSDNLIYQSFLHLYEAIQLSPPPVKIRIRLNVPLSRGLGSSATAIVGGLVGANAIAHYPLSSEEILKLAVELEGHPDNVAPALLGSCQLSVCGPDGKTVCIPVDWASNIIAIAAIPDFELSTHEARSVLPASCSYTDAVYNASHLALLVKALESGREDWLRVALNDRLHQPYRAGLIRGYQAVQNAAVEAGACGLVISGAGPTLLALSPASCKQTVASAIHQAWESEGVSAQVLTLPLDYQGTQACSQTNQSASLQVSSAV